MIHAHRDVLIFRRPVRLLAALCLLAAPLVDMAGPSTRGLDRRAVPPLDRVEMWVAPTVNVVGLLAEDDLSSLRKDAPYRIGLNQDSDLSPMTDGSWYELPGGDRLWRLRIKSPDALWVALAFDEFRLQPGAELRLYSPDRDSEYGPYGASDVQHHGQLWPPRIAGDTIVAELYWPASLAAEKPRLHLGKVTHGYKAWQFPSELGPDESPDPLLLEGTSGTCNIDINCPLGDAWQDEKRGVVGVVVNNQIICSGSLVTNTCRNCAPYVLTAHHCGVGNPASAASTRFWFNYDRSGCGTGTASPDVVIGGATVSSTWFNSDFTLLKMNNPPPAGFEPYFNGWSASPVPALEVHTIHHPSGDTKKISYSDDAVFDAGGGTPGVTHWRVDNWENGTTEPGSSGSPLFDPEHRIIGQLTGGEAACAGSDPNLLWDVYGQVSISWAGGGSSGNHLSTWLDPGATGTTFADGLDYLQCPTLPVNFDIEQYGVDDSQGTDDGIIDPGETVALGVELLNNGDTTGTSVAATLTTTTPGVTIVNGQSSWPDVVACNTLFNDTADFTFRVAPDFPCGDPIQFDLNVTTEEQPGGQSVSFMVTTGPNCTSCPDADGDGYGSPASPVCAGGALVDCNDGAAGVHPGAIEVCGNGVDDDCAGGDTICSDSVNDLLVDLGADGLWLYTNNSAWSSVNSNDPEGLAYGDLDGNGVMDIVADFGTGGTWARYNNATWQAINLPAGATNETMAVGNLDGDTTADIVFDLGPGFGVQVLYDGTPPFVTIDASADPEEILADADLDGNGQDDPVFDLGSSGITILWNDGGALTPLSATLDPEIMISANVNGNARDDVIFDFGGSVYQYLDGTTWNAWLSLDPSLMVAGELNGTGADEIVLYFPASGLTYIFENNAWRLLLDETIEPALFSITDLNDNGTGDLVVHFVGVDEITYVYFDGSVWQLLLTNLAAQEFEGGNFDGVGSGGGGTGTKVLTPELVRRHRLGTARMPDHPERLQGR